MKDYLCRELLKIGIVPESMSLAYHNDETVQISLDGHLNGNALLGYAAKRIFKKTGVPTSQNRHSPSRILKSGDVMVVFWEDGDKTVVKRAPDEPESDYAAFTAALGIKIFGSNSALKRVVGRVETQEKKKREKPQKPDLSAKLFDDFVAEHGMMWKCPICGEEAPYWLDRGDVVAECPTCGTEFREGGE